MVALLVTPARRISTADALERLLRSHAGVAGVEVTTFDEVETRCRGARPGLVLVLLAPDTAAGALAVIRGLRGVGAEHVLVVGPATDPKFILSAMQAGGDFFIDQEDLEKSLDSALARFRHTEPVRRVGELIAVLSAAGGCGASTLAVNLAVQLARAHGRCNLLDLNTNKADLAALLDLKPQYTLPDLCRREERLDRTLYEQLLTVHDSGVALLAGPRGYDEARAFTTGGVEQALGIARASFAHVVADLEDCFHDEQLFALSQATRILIVCRLDFLAVRSARRVLDFLTARGAPREQIEIVVNRTGCAGELLLADAEAAVGAKFTHLIPDAPETVCAAANAGVPATILEPESDYAQSVARIVGLQKSAPPKPALHTRVREWARERLLPWLRARRDRLKRSLKRSPSQSPGTDGGEAPHDVAPPDSNPVAVSAAAPAARPRAAGRGRGKRGRGR